jgi:hypothetical protein
MLKVHISVLGTSLSSSNLVNIRHEWKYPDDRSDCVQFDKSQGVWLPYPLFRACVRIRSATGGTIASDTARG